MLPVARPAQGWRAAQMVALLLVALVFPSHVPAQAPQTVASQIRLPPGFRIEVLAAVPAARSLALGTRGTLFVGSRNGDRVQAIALRPLAQGGYRTDPPRVLAQGLNSPNGVAFRDGALYVAEIGRILRLDTIESRLDTPPAPAVVYDRLPGDAHHGWKFIRFGPDGHLYIPVGAPCNVCAPDPDRYALIGRLKINSGNAVGPLEVFARGVRNSVGFDWDPASRELWFTDNGRDWLGDDMPADELNHAPRAGMHFGFPFCHQGDVPDPEFGRARGCAAFTPPARKLGPHVAALGMRFYTGTQFPAEYRNQLFIAEHGSWNRAQRIGYRITLVRMQGNRVLGYETFAEGWLAGGKVLGRPVDIEILPDGSLAVSDDHAGLIYRIWYAGPDKG
jgi:glucose/arabinose dehydrogenase